MTVAGRQIQNRERSDRVTMDLDPNRLPGRYAPGSVFVDPLRYVRYEGPALPVVSVL